MPWKRRGRTSPLPVDIQRRINDVHAGRSTALSLGIRETAPFTEIPPEIRELTDLRHLSLGNAAINKLPSWLEELPNLKVIDISQAQVAAIPPFKSDIRWSIDARQIFSFGSRLNQSKIYAISIRVDATQQALERIFYLNRYGTLELSGFSIGTSFTYDIGNREAKEVEWPFLQFINSELDQFLEANQKLRTLDISGFPIGRIPEPICRLRSLESITLMGVWPASIPDWLFQAPKLTSINLALNGLSILPDALGEARRLEYLNLAYNMFKRIPFSVWKLKELKDLDIRECPIEEIPADILRLEKLSGLYLDSGASNFGTSHVPRELVIPPPEIAARGLDAIRRYWTQERDAGIDYLAEAKLLIVGESGAGKTSLAKNFSTPAIN
jgi:internalin A